MNAIVLLAILGLTHAADVTTQRPNLLGNTYGYQNQPNLGGNLQPGLNQPLNQGQPLNNQGLNNQGLNQNLPVGNVEGNLPNQPLPVNSQLPLTQGVQGIPIVSGQNLMPLNTFQQPLTVVQPIYVPYQHHGFTGFSNFNTFPQPMTVMAGRATPVTTPVTTSIATPVSTPIITQPIHNKPIIAMPLTSNRHMYTTQKHYIGGGYPYYGGYSGYYDPYSYQYQPYYGYPYGSSYYPGYYPYGGYSGFGSGYGGYTGGIWNQNTNLVSVDPLISTGSTTTPPLTSSDPLLGTSGVNVVAH